MESWLVVFTLLLRLLSPWARRHGFATIKTQPGSVCLASLSAASVVTAAWSEGKTVITKLHRGLCLQRNRWQLLSHIIYNRNNDHRPSAADRRARNGIIELHVADQLELAVILQFRLLISQAE